MITAIYDEVGWNATLRLVAFYDFYHTYQYHQLSKEENEIPILLVYKKDDLLIAIPLLLRHIPNSIYKDATSVYGYAGPISKNIPDDFDNSEFSVEVKSFLSEKKIVTVFSRLNPFIAQQRRILFEMGDVQNIGKMVNIDISRDLAVQRQQYGNRLKSHINKTKALCHIKTAESDEEILAFIKMYTDTMHRVDAKEFYFFEKNYFLDLMNSTSFDAEILFCVENETKEILGGILFVTTNGIVQYHLSGMKERYQNIYPTKYILDEMRIRSTAKKGLCFNLGGGLGTDEDSLFHFKSSFSKDFIDFDVWKWVIDEKVNRQLVKAVETREVKEFLDARKKFFPLYRGKVVYTIVKD